MKRLFMILCCLCLCLSMLVSCGKDETPASSSTPPPVESGSAIIDSPDQSTPKSPGIPLEDVGDILLPTVEKSYGEGNVAVWVEEDTLIFAVQAEGTEADIKKLIDQGAGPDQKNWLAVKNYVLQLCEDMRVEMDDNGHEDSALKFQILNDAHPEYILLEVVDGDITYDVLANG